MPIRFNTFVPYSPLQAADVNDIANNGVIQINNSGELASLDNNINMAYDISTFTLYMRTAAGQNVANWGTV